MNPGVDYIGVAAGAFIMNEDGEVFLMRRGPASRNEVGHWTIPGGKVDFGETLRDAAIRETREETGVEIEIDGQLPAVNHFIPEEKQHWVMTAFPARITHGVPEIMEPEKCDAIGWFALDDLPSPMAGSVQAVLDNFYNIAP